MPRVNAKEGTTLAPSFSPTAEPHFAFTIGIRIAYHTHNAGKVALGIAAQGGWAMRIITTWMYFDPSQVLSEGRRSWRRGGRGEEQVEPGIGIAWCAGDTTNLMPFDNLKAFRQMPFDHGEINEERLRDYIDVFLTDDREFEFRRPERSIKNPNVVDFVLTEPFVIQRSPPDLLSLQTVITKTKTNLPIFIGTYMGWAVAPEESILLFITVPGGIIIVSSAVGLAEALASGLSTSVKRLFRVK